MDDAEKEILLLRQEIEKHNKNYYVYDNPIISDGEYDELILRLKFLEAMNPKCISNDSPTQKVGGCALKNFKKVVHKTTMESLNDVFKKEEVISFIERVEKILSSNKNLNNSAVTNKLLSVNNEDTIKQSEIRNKDFFKIQKDEVEYALEAKIDGLSVSLEYKNGIFFRGSTRGDGKIGEDVTENLKTISSIPKVLPFEIPFIEVRGEVFIPKIEFDKLNEEREMNAETLFANPRNAAAGSLRQLDSSITKNRKLDILIFNLESLKIGDSFEFLKSNLLNSSLDIDTKNFLLDTHKKSLEFVRYLNFPTNEILYVSSSAKEILNQIDIFNAKKDHLPFQSDGVVIKVNNLDKRKILGSTAKSPRWAVAYKFRPERVETKITSVEFEIGRSGTLTPVANFEPILLAGTIVKKATLHNFDNIERKDIRINDIVVLQKAGDIIPEIVRSIVEKRTGREVKIKIPTLCPSCGSILQKFSDEVAYRCLNHSCSAIKIRQIIHFCSRNAMNILGLGSSLIKKFFEKKLIDDIADIYFLTRDKLFTLERFKEKSINNLLMSIENSKNNNLDRLIYGLGIPLVGNEASKILSKNFKNIWNIIDANRSLISKISLLGDKVAESVVGYFSLDSTHILINKLNQVGVNLELYD